MSSFFHNFCSWIKVFVYSMSKAHKPKWIIFIFSFIYKFFYSIFSFYFFKHIYYSFICTTMCWSP